MLIYRSLAILSLLSLLDLEETLFEECDFDLLFLLLLDEDDELLFLGDSFTIGTDNSGTSIIGSFLITGVSIVNSGTVSGTGRGISFFASSFEESSE